MKTLDFNIQKQSDRMISYWKKEWRVVALIALTGTVYNAAMSAGPVLQGSIIDHILAGAPTREITARIGVYVAAICLIQGIRFLKRYYVRVFANRTSASMRNVVYHNIMSREAGALRGESTGDLMTRGISDVKACVEGMRKATTEVFDTGVLMVSYIIAMLAYDVRLTAAACVCIPLSMAAAGMLKGIIFRYTKACREQLSLVTDITYEMAENTMLYRITGAEDRNLKKYQEQLRLLERKSVLSNMLENSMQPIYKTISFFGVIAICYFGGKNVIEQVWTVGQFTAYLAIFSALAVKASKAAKLFNSVQKAQVSWKRVQPFLKLQKDTKEQEDAGLRQSSAAGAKLPPSSEPGELKEKQALDIRRGISMTDMAFSYPDSERHVVEGVTFQAGQGQLIGITGPVAGGKSTIGAALLGLYPYEGSIRIGGRELRECGAASVSAVLAYMGHDSQLLSDTIYNNITLGDGGDIMPVLHDVCFDEDLAAMPDGIHTLVGNSGVRLSGGQQARLALARALYHNGGILVLDDPFSAVDQKTEHEIIRNIKEHYKDCIILLISHRVACFEQADQVILVKNGRTVCGTHEGLLETSPVYHALFALQKEEQKDA